MITPLCLLSQMKPLNVLHQFWIKKIFRISPNPFQNEIKVTSHEFENEFLFEIYDLNGRKIKSGLSYTNKPIQIENIMNGIYLIKIKFQNREEVHRIIKSS